MIGALHLAALFVIAILAAMPAYYVLRRTNQGRARGAIAYLGGFLFGFAGFLLLPTRDPILAQSALLAAFFGPFMGMSRARYMRQRKARGRRRRSQRADTARA